VKTKDERYEIGEKDENEKKIKEIEGYPIRKICLKKT